MGIFSKILFKPIKPRQLLKILLELCAGKTDDAKKDKPITSIVTNKQHWHILLAEDNVINQKVTIKMLERLGYRADVAANGYEVLSALNRQSYDLIFMDVSMPEMDGLEASRRISKTYPHPPLIIALTAHAQIGDRKMCMDAGMTDYLSKPVKIGDLKAILQRYLPM